MECWSEKLKGRDPLAELGLDEDNIKIDLMKDVAWIHSGLEQGPVAGCCEGGNGLPSSVKGKEFLQ
jgi:hypothetical protein